MSIDELIDWVMFPHVVITGGEPLYQSSTISLISVLLAEGYQVHVETNGTYTDAMYDLLHTVREGAVWVTLSPKRHNLPHDSAYRIAKEIKVPVQNQGDVDWALALRKRLGSEPLFYLQPVSQDPVATKLCYDTCMAHPAWFRLSVQTHKYINVK